MAGGGDLRSARTVGVVGASVGPFPVELAGGGLDLAKSGSSLGRPNVTPKVPSPAGAPSVAFGWKKGTSLSQLGRQGASR